MKYRDLQIQTQREAPNNARTEGFLFLVRAGYLTRENVPTQLGEITLNYLRYLSNESFFATYLSLESLLISPHLINSIPLKRLRKCRTFDRMLLRIHKVVKSLIFSFQSTVVFLL